MLTAAVVAALAAESVLWPLGRDQGIYAWVADVIHDGGLPYEDAWDIKGPGTFYTVALGHLVLGRHSWSIRVVDLALLAVTCGALARIARAWGGGRLGAVVAPGLFALWYIGGGFWDTAQPDAWATTLLSVAVAVVVTGRFELSRRMAVAGLLIGAGVTYKPLFGVFLVVLAAAWAATTGDGPRPWSALAIGFGAAAVVPVVALVWFWANGGLGDLLDVQLEFNRTSYRADAPLPDQLSSIRAYLVAQVGVALPVAALGTVALLSRRRGDGVVVVCWWLTGLAVVVAQGRYFTYHWAPVSAALAVAAAVGCAQLLDARVPATVLAGALLLASAWAPVDAAVRRVVDAAGGELQYEDPFVKADFSAEKNQRISAWLRRRTEPGEAVLLWGYEPAIHFLSDRRSATRFGYTLPLIGEGAAGSLVRKYRRELMADLRRRPPPWVVVVEGDGNPVLPAPSRRYLEDFTGLDRFIDDRYTEVARIGSDATVLHRRDA